MTNQIRRPREINSIQKAVEDYDMLTNEVEQLRAEKIQNKDMIVNIMAENQLLKTRLDFVELERDQLKTYTYDLVARLDVIVETITAAKSRARNLALKDDQRDDQHETLEVDDNDTSSRETRGLEEQVRETMASVVPHRRQR